MHTITFNASLPFLKENFHPPPPLSYHTPTPLIHRDCKKSLPIYRCFYTFKVCAARFTGRYPFPEHADARVRRACAPLFHFTLDLPTLHSPTCSVTHQLACPTHLLHSFTVRPTICVQNVMKLFLHQQGVRAVVTLNENFEVFISTEQYRVCRRSLQYLVLKSSI